MKTCRYRISRSGNVTCLDAWIKETDKGNTFGEKAVFARRFAAECKSAGRAEIKVLDRFEEAMKSRFGDFDSGDWKDQDCVEEMESEALAKAN